MSSVCSRRWAGSWFAWQDATEFLQGRSGAGAVRMGQWRQRGRAGKHQRASTAVSRDQIEQMIADRAAAKKAKNYAEADRIRANCLPGALCSRYAQAQLGVAPESQAALAGCLVNGFFAIRRRTPSLCPSRTWRAVVPVSVFDVDRLQFAQQFLCRSVSSRGLHDHMAQEVAVGMAAHPLSPCAKTEDLCALGFGRNLDPAIRRASDFDFAASAAMVKLIAFRNAGRRDRAGIPRAASGAAARTGRRAARR